MSLLLKALENAAKNRETAGSAASESGAAPEMKEPSAEEITLEPMPQTARARAGARAQGTARTSGSGAALDEERAPSPHQSQAQSVLRAGAPASRPGIFEWFARRPLVAFSTAAGIFAIGYGTYLYLQLTHPGIFMSRPAPVPKPPVVATSPSPTPAPPAPGIAPIPPTPPAASPPPAAPSSVLPGPAFTPGASPAPPPAAAAPVAPPAIPSPPAAAAAPAPGVPSAAPAPEAARAAPTPAQPGPPAAKIAVVPEQPDVGAPARARAAKPAPSRPGTTPPLAEGIAPNPMGQVVPVNTTLSSAHQALEKGQLDEAERLYRQTLANDPRNVDAMLGLAAALTPQNKTDAATQYYVRVLEQEPRNAYAQAGLLNLTGRADPVAAEGRLKQLIARDPSAFLYFTLGNLYAEHGQWAPAQAAYFQAHTLSPDNPDYAFNLAVGLEHLSQPRIALNYYRRALTLAQSRGHAQFDTAGVQT